MKDGLLRCPKRKKCDVRRFALLNKGKRQLIIVKGEKWSSIIFNDDQESFDWLNDDGR